MFLVMKMMEPVHRANVESSSFVLLSKKERHSRSDRPFLRFKMALACLGFLKKRSTFVSLLSETWENHETRHCLSVTLFTRAVLLRFVQTA
jgi:hypothetical protein